MAEQSQPVVTDRRSSETSRGGSVVEVSCGVDWLQAEPLPVALELLLRHDSFGRASCSTIRQAGVARAPVARTAPPRRCARSPAPQADPTRFHVPRAGHTTCTMRNTVAVEHGTARRHPTRDRTHRLLVAADFVEFPPGEVSSVRQVAGHPSQTSDVEVGAEGVAREVREEASGRRGALPGEDVVVRCGRNVVHHEEVAAPGGP